MYKKVQYDINVIEKMKNKDSVIKYLKKGNVIGACAGNFKDPFTGENLGYNNVLSDGFYEWKQSLPYLLEKYEIKLPDKFIEHCMDKI